MMIEVVFVFHFVFNSVVGMTVTARDNVVNWGVVLNDVFDNWGLVVMFNSSGVVFP